MIHLLAVTILPPDAGMNPQAAFVENLETIDRIIGAVCRRHILVGDDRDDFDSYAKMRLIEGDYAVFAKFQGLSTLATYLTVVITRFFQDFRTSRWGRWRHSAEAKRLGPVALNLEILIYRDRYSVREAIQILRSRGGELPTDRELFELAARIPARTPAREVSSSDTPDPPSTDTADGELLQEENDNERKRILQEVERALQTFPSEDLVILRMRLQNGLSVADIARLLKTAQKPLYRRIEKNRERLRLLLKERGITGEGLAW